MAVMSYSYNDTMIAESRWNQIKDLNAINTYVTSRAGTVEVTQRVFSWDIDPIDTETGQVGAVEGADTVYAQTDPTQGTNYTQIIEKSYKVSTRDEDSRHAAFKSRKAREIMKKTLSWKNQFELSAVVGVATAGNVTTGSTMKGIRNFATGALTTAETAGTVLDSAHLNTYLSKNWAVGAQIDTLLCYTQVKSRIDSFTVGNTRNVDAKDAAVVGRVDVYDSSYGRVDVVLHRYVAQGEIIGYIEDYVKVGFLTAPRNEDRARTGSYMPGVIYGDATVMVANPNAVLLATGLTG